MIIGGNDMSNKNSLVGMFYIKSTYRFLKKSRATKGFQVVFLPWGRVL